MKDVNEVTVLGVGYMGEEGYTCTNYPKTYKLWFSMISRCYGENKQEAYKNVTVHPDWFNFSQFVKDIKKLKGYTEWSEGKKWELDKDLKSGEVKQYSKDTCCFIPGNFNRRVVFAQKFPEYDYTMHFKDTPEYTATYPGQFEEF